MSRWRRDSDIVDCAATTCCLFETWRSSRLLPQTGSRAATFGSLEMLSSWAAAVAAGAGTSDNSAHSGSCTSRPNTASRRPSRPQMEGRDFLDREAPEDDGCWIWWQRNCRWNLSDWWAMSCSTVGASWTGSRDGAWTAMPAGWCSTVQKQIIIVRRFSATIVSICTPVLLHTCIVVIQALRCEWRTCFVAV